MILDGGLATELEQKDFDLYHPLWSARLLSENPDAIKKVHMAYLKAGADVITTASYQASFEGFAKFGFSREEAESLLSKSVQIAIESRDEFFAKKDGPTKPLIAASVGPYGAYLANGAEYTGEYGVSNDVLYDFHARRWEILADTGADLIACETIPSFSEAEVLKKLIEQTKNKLTYVSFSCNGSENINDGTPIKRCAEMLVDCENAFAVGINCTSPRFVSNLIDQIKVGAPEKEIVVYPNSGETYHVKSKTWKGTSSEQDLASCSVGWFQQGARFIGGCCRTSPSHTRAIHESLQKNKRYAR